MSLPRRYDSSVPRSRVRCLRSRSRDRPQLRARVVDDVAGRDRSSGGCRRSRDRRRRRCRRWRAGSDASLSPADGVGGVRRLRSRNVGEGDELERLERAAFDGEPAQRRIEIGRRPQADVSIGHQTRRFRWSRPARCARQTLRLRLQPFEAPGPPRRQRKTARRPRQSGRIRGPGGRLHSWKLEKGVTTLSRAPATGQSSTIAQAGPEVTALILGLSRRSIRRLTRRPRAFSRATRLTASG